MLLGTTGTILRLLGMSGNAELACIMQAMLLLVAVVSQMLLVDPLAPLYHVARGENTGCDSVAREAVQWGVVC